jgi:ABC-type multidrug transport system ATPase subunit
VYSASNWVQAEELLRKRFITSSRDLKGLFFQVVFPAFQILLILAILTININPAGHTVKMNASIFGFSPNTIVAGRAQIDDFASNMSSSRLIISRYKANTSEALANTLLESGNRLFKGAKALARTLPPSDRRLGAIVFNDKLLVKFDVDWAWIKNNLRFILSNTEIIDFALSSFGVPNDRKKRQSYVIPSSVITGILQPRRKNAPVVSTAKDKQNLKDFIRSVGDIAKVDTGAVDQLFNSSIFDSFNASGYYDAGSQQSVTISFNSVDSNSQGITLKNLRVKTNSKRIKVGDVRLTDAQIRFFLPDHIIEYEIKFPVPVTVMHNSTSAHGIAAFRGEVISAAWQKCYDDLDMTASQRKLSPNVEYLAKNHPLPLTARQSLQNRVLLSLLASLFILVPLCYIPASFITFVVRERMSKAKHLQIVSSVSPYLYWSTTYLWDMGLFLILVLLIIGAFFIYGKKAAEIFISVDEAAGAVFLLLFTYGLSVLPICYLYSMCFENHSTAQISIMAINFASGFVAVLAYFVMNTVPETQVAASRIVHVFRFFPPYNIGEGLIAIATAYLENTLLDAKVGYFNFKVAGRNILFMVLQALGYMALVLFTESPYYRNAAYWLERQRALLVLKKSVMEATDVDGNLIPVDKDEDILIEEDVVAKTANKGDFALCIENLVKIYPSNFVGGKAKHAVRGLTLGCQSGERFGFLGVNGAGKSSTLNVLTGDIAPTGGEIFIGGMPLSDPKTRESIGYCPQTDPLFDLMTARETLWFYGRIRGIEPTILHRKVEALIRQVGLTPHADRTSGTYSGGNKRKLSLAISLIGSPTVLLLDEPSSGMDPFARRQMWDVIAAVSEKRSVILTTHSMEECEALCTRIGIMVDGRLRCLGPSSHLKARFGNGYQIEVRFSAEDRFEECMELLRSICEDVEIDEKHGQFLRLKVPALDLGYAFKILEESKMCVSGCIVDYTVSQNTLEQVFLKFARMQEQIEGEQDLVDASHLVV